MTKAFVTTLLFSIATLSYSQTRTKSEAKFLADSLFTRIQKGEKIQTLARLYSEDPSSANNGGFVKFKPNDNQVIASFEDVVTKLSVDEISRPFETEFGYHIVYILTKADTLIELRHILVTYKK